MAVYTLRVEHDIKPVICGRFMATSDVMEGADEGDAERRAELPEDGVESTHHYCVARFDTLLGHHHRVGRNLVWIALRG